jgi:hypothetical protein
MIADNVFHADKTVTVTINDNPTVFTTGSPSSVILGLKDQFTPPSATDVTVNAVIVSGADDPLNAVENLAPGSAYLTGGIIALGGGNVPPATSPANVYPQMEYLEGTWVPPVMVYGVDTRVEDASQTAIAN